MNKHYMKPVLLLTSIVIFIVLVVSFVKNKPVSVSVASSEQNIEVSIYGLGTIEARIRSRIGFEVGAAIIELNADQGDRVKKGTVLARLHSAEQDAKTQRAAAIILAAEAQLEKARANIPKMQAVLAQRKENNKRSQALLSRQTISEEEADETQMEQDIATAELSIARSDIVLAEAELGDARAQYNYEKELLEHHVLRAPYDGLVIERHKELGAVLSPGEAVFTLVDPETVWALGYVDEARAGDIREGQPAQVRLRSLPHEAFQGKVARIDIESDRVSEERRVYIRCDVCPDQFYLGEQAEIFIQTAILDDTFLVPETAIDTFDGAGGIVWVIKKGRLQRQSVTFGHKTLDGRVEITGGLESSMQVVTTLPKGLREGRRVSVMKGK